MTLGPARRLVVCAALAAAAAACGPTASSGGGGSGFPQPGPAGTPIGDPTVQPVAQPGGLLASPDGFLVVDVPAGATAAPVQFTVQEVTNLAPGGVGPAWKLGPEGTAFAKPITLTFFSGAVGRPVDEITVTWQDDQGFWHRAVPDTVVRDPLSNTLTVQTSHFSSWTLTTTPTARDLTGPFSVGTTLGTPFTAAGNATFTFAGEDADATYYLLSGTLVLPSPLTSGATTCTPTPPETPSFAVRTNVGELSKSAPTTFDWGTSAGWNVTCADGTTRVVSVAFDTVGIGFVGCTRVVTSPEAAGVDAAHGGVTWDCTSRGLGQVSGTWNFQSAACGTACATANPCRTAAVQCGSGSAVCTESGNVADGSSCGTDQVCSAGVCVGCTAGLACTPANPCSVGVTSCATGASTCVESTTPATPVANGTTCGTDLVCSAGACLSCATGAACTPANPCHQGATSCATGSSVCVDSTLPVTDGTTCGTDLVCFSGACIACTQGAACTSANPCTATATYECSSGAAVCTDRLSQPAGTACGAGLVCSATGVCSTCTEGAACTPSNPCASGAAISCASGSPVCTDTGTPAPAGTPCGPNQYCTATGQCVVCNSGASCIPGIPANPCLTGTVSCPPVPATCVAGVPVANGTTCGANQVCNAGLCNACTQGALCASSNPCVSTATIACATGTPVCTDGTFLTPGALCGTNQVCSPSGVCTACTQGAACTPTNPCATSGTTRCGTGAPVCADQFFAAGGTGCGTNQVCTPGGVCVACTQGAACTSTNPCAATATLECASGNPTCTDRTFAADGTGCGAGQSCNAGVCIGSRTVTGTRTATYWPDAGATTPAAPANAATSSVSALVSDGKGGWSSYAGTVSAAGAASIPSVPTGTFWLRFAEPGGSPTFLDTAGATSVDLGYDQLGRSSVVRATSSNLVSFTLSLATGWAASGLDQLQIASSNADFWDRLAPFGTRTNGGRNGTWQDDWFTGNAGGAPQNRLATSDSNTVYHLISRTDATSGRQYVAASSQGTNTTVNIGTGPTQTVASRTLNTNGLTNRTLASGTWSLTAFEALRTAMNLPSGGTHTLVVGASVGTITGNGPVPRNAPPTLFIMTAPAGTTPNPNLGTALTYARVLTTTRWNEWRGVDFTGSVSFTAPGATAAVTETVSVGRREAMPAASALTPTLTPVQNLSVTATTGLVSPAYGAVSGTGLTPTLRWSAPVTGTVTSYVVEVFRLGLNVAATTSTKVATFVTASTQVALPTGVLAAGSAHYVRVTARAIASDPWANAPFRQVVVGAWAATLSGTITP
jgi:hypothetical protein